MKTPRRIVALALFCAGIAALLAIPVVSAQTPTDYDTDNDGLIEVDSLAKLNAIRWDLNGDGVVDSADQTNYLAAFPNAPVTAGCTYDHDGNSQTTEVACIGYELTANLNFSGSNWASGQGDGKGWVPIGEYTSGGTSPYGSPYSAIFDGNNNTISNLYINRPDEEGVGLFGNVSHESYSQGDAVKIRNVKLRDVNVRGSENVGALIGHFGLGSVSNSSVTGGTVTAVVRQDENGDDVGGLTVGGLVGNSSGPISDSSAAVTVAGRIQVAGLVGESSDPITNSHATGAVSGEDDVGGLVGRNNDSIDRSYATGDVTGTGDDGGSSIGGLVGTHWYDNSVISNSYATGNVRGEHFVGGLVGLVWGGHIRTSYATGDVTGQGACVVVATAEPTPCTDAGLASGDLYEHVTTRIGGLVGGNRGATISTSFASGDVAGMHHVGGLVGENIGRTIRATYAHGDVTVTGPTENVACDSDSNPGCRIGGLVGRNINGGAIINSYAIGKPNVEAVHLRVGGLAGESPTERLYDFGGYVNPGSITASYWDTETSEFPVGVGTDDENNNRIIDERDLNARPPVFGETAQDGVAGKTTSELQTPTDYTGIYATWDDSPDLDLDNADGDNDHATGQDAPWYFGEDDEYPVFKIDVDLDGDVDQDDYDAQQPGPPNQRPTVSISIPSSVTQPVNGRTRVTPTVTANDPDGSISSYEWTATGGTFANAATRNATWTAPAEEATEQTYTLTLKVTDNGGKSNSASVDIRVIKTNVLPTVSIQEVTQEVAGGATVTFDATADDTDGTIESYEWDAPTNGGTFVDHTIEDATWTAPAEQENAQDYTLTLTVTDDRGGQTTTNTTVTVQAANKKPTVTIHTGTQTVSENAVVTLSATAEDPDRDGSIVSYAWTASPNLGTFGNAADEDTTWTAPAKTANEQRITLRLTATDNEGATGYAEVLMKVSGNNQPGAFITTLGQDVNGGDEVQLSATVSDPDEEDVTYEWTGAGDFSPDSGTISHPYTDTADTTWTAPAKTNDAQEVTLTLTGSDGTLTSSAQVTMKVRANQAPTIDGITNNAPIVDGEPTVSGGDEVNVSATVTETDTDDTLTYTWTADDGDANTTDDGSFATDPNNPDGERSTARIWTAPAKINADRPIRLTLTVSDGLTSHTASVVITVKSNATPTITGITNDAPLVDGVPTIGGGLEVELRATVTDDDADNTLTYEWTATNPVGTDTGTFSPTDAATTTWTAPAKTNTEQAIALTLTVTDPGGLSGKKTVTIRVSLNQTPRITGITIDGDAVSYKLVAGGDSVALVATATDPDDGDTLEYEWSTNDGRAADVAFDPEDAATTTWTAPDAKNTAQAITLTLRVSDGGLAAIATINITVEANEAPTIEIDTPAQTVAVGTVVQLATTVTDEDTGSLQYQWQANGGTFSSGTIQNPTWTAPSQVTARTSYTLTVIVTDNGKPNGLTDSDAITITVHPDPEPPNPNNPPMLTIDTQRQTVGGGETINLEATVTDADTNDTHTYAWTGRGNFDNAAAEDTEWTAPARLGSAQSIVLRLTVTDSGGLEDTKTVTITVSGNTIPNVLITGDRQRTVYGNEVIDLSATVSDPDGDDLDYEWSEAGTFSPASGTFTDPYPNPLTTQWTAPDADSTERSYTLNLHAEDTGGLEHGDAITVIVRANQSPTVEISTVAATVDGEAAVDLAATASDPDDDDATLKYRWTADPNYGTFADRNALTTTWTAPATPNVSLPINLTLTVTDPDGLEVTDTVTITVRGSTTAPPPPPPRPQELDRDDDADGGDGGDGGGGGGDGGDGGGGGGDGGDGGGGGGDGGDGGGGGGDGGDGGGGGGDGGDGGGGGGDSGDGGGGGSSGGGGGGSSEWPKLIGENGSAKAWELENNSVLLEIHNPDDPDNPRKVTFGIGSINTEGTEIVPVGYVRDDSLGQTYAVLRREADGAIVRQWIASDSPLALIVPWDDVNTNYTFPVLVIVTIPLDEKRPHPNQLVRRFDGGDDRILSYDAGLLQWRHVPDAATFQVLGFYWCDVTAADENFFNRIHIGTPHPPTTVPAQENYPSCRP